MKRIILRANHKVNYHLFLLTLRSFQSNIENKTLPEIKSKLLWKEGDYIEIKKKKDEIIVNDNLKNEEIILSNGNLKKMKNVITKENHQKKNRKLITFTPIALSHMRKLMKNANNMMIKIGIKNKGCLGSSYHFEYVDKKNDLDEIFEQEEVRVVISANALFSIIGSEIDYINDDISSKFVFKNPNCKTTCGCGESFKI